MKTITLTVEQLNLITRALGIAEQKFTLIHEDIMKNTINVRGVNDLAKMYTENMMYHELACDCADLNVTLNSGELDMKFDYSKENLKIVETYISNLRLNLDEKQLDSLINDVFNQMQHIYPSQPFNKEMVQIYFENKYNF